MSLDPKLDGYGILTCRSLYRTSVRVARAKALCSVLSTPSTHFPHYIEQDRFARQLHKVLQSDAPPVPNADGTKEGDRDFLYLSPLLVLLSTVTLCGLPFFLSVPPTDPTLVLFRVERASRPETRY
jgi:hypothetical protein